MSKNIGLWIDHRKAVIVILKDKRVEEIKLTESDLEKQVQSRGGAHMKTTHTAQYFPAEDHKDRQCMEKLNKYYGAIVSILRGAESVMIFGPGEAKFELEKRIAHRRVPVQIVAVETADKMTDRQIAARVRRYFQK